MSGGIAPPSELYAEKIRKFFDNDAEKNKQKYVKDIAKFVWPQIVDAINKDDGLHKMGKPILRVSDKAESQSEYNHLRLLQNYITFESADVVFNPRIAGFDFIERAIAVAKHLNCYILATINATEDEPTINMYLARLDSGMFMKFRRSRLLMKVENIFTIDPNPCAEAVNSINEDRKNILKVLVDVAMRADEIKNSKLYFTCDEFAQSCDRLVKYIKYYLNCCLQKYTKISAMMKKSAGNFAGISSEEYEKNYNEPDLDDETKWKQAQKYIKYFNENYECVITGAKPVVCIAEYHIWSAINARIRDIIASEKSDVLIYLSEDEIIRPVKKDINAPYLCDLVNKYADENSLSIWQRSAIISRVANTIDDYLANMQITHYQIRKDMIYEDRDLPAVSIVVTGKI